VKNNSRQETSFIYHILELHYWRRQMGGQTAEENLKAKRKNWRSTGRTLRRRWRHGWESSSNNLTQKRAKDCSFFVWSPYLLTSGMLGVGIYFCARLRGKPHITFYGEVQDQPLRVKFTLYGLIATYDRTHHRHQWSDAAMVFLHTYVKNHVWNCYVLEGCGWGTDYDHKVKDKMLKCFYMIIKISPRSPVV
jgi:hypothetical protein